MASQILSALITVIIGVGGCLAYFWGLELAARPAWSRPTPATMPRRSGNMKLAGCRSGRGCSSRPALILLVLYLVYPVFETLRLSFHDKAGDTFVGITNYRWALNDASSASRSSTTSCGCWWCRPPAPPRPCHRRAHRPHLVGRIAKSLIFMPMAISFVGA